MDWEPMLNKRETENEEAGWTAWSSSPRLWLWVEWGQSIHGSFCSAGLPSFSLCDEEVIPPSVASVRYSITERENQVHIKLCSVSDVFKKGPISWRKITGAQGNQKGFRRQVAVLAAGDERGSGKWSWGGVSALRACTIPWLFLAGVGAWSRPWLWRPWDWQGLILSSQVKLPTQNLYLPASLISGHSQFWDFLVSLRSGMLCCVLLSTDSGHCTHAALEFLRMEFPPRFSDNFHLISLKKKRKEKTQKC